MCSSSRPASALLATCPEVTASRALALPVCATGRLALVAVAAAALRRATLLRPMSFLAVAAAALLARPRRQRGLCSLVFLVCSGMMAVLVVRFGRRLCAYTDLLAYFVTVLAASACPLVDRRHQTDSYSLLVLLASVAVAVPVVSRFPAFFAQWLLSLATLLMSLLCAVALHSSLHVLLPVCFVLRLPVRPHQMDSCSLLVLLVFVAAAVPTVSHLPVFVPRQQFLEALLHFFLSVVGPALLFPPHLPARPPHQTDSCSLLVMLASVAVEVPVAFRLPAFFAPQLFLATLLRLLFSVAGPAWPAPPLPSRPPPQHQMG